MQSILIVSKTKDNLQKKAQEIVDENNISKFDVQTYTSDKQIGIPDIRALQKTIFLTTVKSEKKAVIIEAFLGMTQEAQNAFLKILEEPPLSTIIIILVSSLDFILPTVMSRCNLINLDTVAKLTNEQAQKNLQILLLLKKDKIANALTLAQDNSKTKEDALAFLQGLTITAHSLIGQNNDFSDKEITKMLKDFQKFYTIIKSTNVNVRFALENLFLNI